MNTVEIIRKKRNNGILSKDEISFMINGLTQKTIPDYQFSAFLMAVYLNGMNEEETAYLTGEMLYSGTVLDLSDIPGIKIDKHSTGGVGDKTSLILAPIAAAAGVTVPMISGRGLGHTGGTLDKLESIPGFNTGLNAAQFKRILAECGCALIGQTAEIAPADKIIYSLRDVTATVESIPLITASIMSKKLAEGADGLVLDIKTGSGAFMRNYEDSKMLALSLIETALRFDKKVIGFITDMNQPLGNYIGNWLEVLESIKILKGELENDLSELSFYLSGAMLLLADKCGSLDEGVYLSRETVKSGKAFGKFLEIVKLQGGNEDFILNPEKYPAAKFKSVINSSGDGYLAEIDNYQIGMASLELGAGRRTKEDKIDPSAGIIFYPKIGDKLDAGDPVCELFTNDEKTLGDAENRIKKALRFSASPVERIAVIQEIIT